MTFFKIGLFTFGGGYAMIPLLQAELVRKKKWSSDGLLLHRPIDSGDYRH